MANQALYVSPQASGPDQMQKYQLSLLERILKKLGEAHQLCIAQPTGDVTGLVDDAAGYFAELLTTAPRAHVKPQIQLHLPLLVPERVEPLPRWIPDMGGRRAE